MLIWLGRGHLFAFDSHGFFSTDKPYKKDKITDVYRKERSVTIALILH